VNDLIAIQKTAGWESLKALVLDSVTSPITKPVYNMALDEFLAWLISRPRSLSCRSRSNTGALLARDTQVEPLPNSDH